MNSSRGVCKITFEKIKKVPFHINSNLKIIYMLEGALVLTWVSGDYVIKKGEMEILNIDEPVRMEAIDDENLMLVLEIDTEFAKNCDRMIDKTTYNCNISNFFTSVASKEKQQELLGILHRVCINYYKGGSAETWLSEMLSLICNDFNDVKNMFKDQKFDINVERFLRINNFLMEHAEEKITLKDIAEIEFLSLQYLSKEFHEKLKKNYQAVLYYYRIIKAVKLLIKTNMPISQISDQCGFSDIRYFYKQFGIYFTCTPSEFRNRLRIETKDKVEIPLTDEEALELLGKSLHHAAGNKHREIHVAVNKIDECGETIDYAGYVKKIFRERNTEPDPIFDTHCFGALITEDFFMEKGNVTLKERDEPREGIFTGQNGIFMSDGTPKPSYWAINFINALQEKVVERGENYIVTQGGDGEFSALVVNCQHLKTMEPKEIGEYKEWLTFSLDCGNLSEEYLAEIKMVNEINGSLYSLYEKYRSWLDLDEEVKKGVSKPSCVHEYIREGRKTVTIELGPYEFAQIRLKPVLKIVKKSK